MSGSAIPVAGLLVIVASAAVYLAALWLIDPYEREPVSDLGLILLAGAVIAPLLTAGLDALLGLPFSLQPAAATLAFGAPNLWGPIVEEVAKGAVIFGAFLVFRREFDDTLDGVVYGAVTGLGFALAGSLVYLRTLAASGTMAGTHPAPVFAVFVASLNQCFFSALFGAGLGAAREGVGLGALAPLAGLVAAAVYHAGYAGLTLLSATPAAAGRSWAAWAGAARVVADLAGVLLILVLARWAWEHERRMLGRTLGDEVASGAVTREELALLAAGKHGRHQFNVWRRRGWRQYLAVRRLHRVQAHLAFAKWRDARGIGREGEVAACRDAVGRARAVVAEEVP